MTLEELLGFDAERWKTITDEQIRALCEPYFSVTRPDESTPRSSKPLEVRITSPKKQLSEADRAKQDKIALAKKMMKMWNI